MSGTYDAVREALELLKITDAEPDSNGKALMRTKQMCTVLEGTIQMGLGGEILEDLMTFQKEDLQTIAGVLITLIDMSKAGAMMCMQALNQLEKEGTSDVQ